MLCTRAHEVEWVLKLTSLLRVTLGDRLDSCVFRAEVPDSQPVLDTQMQWARNDSTPVAREQRKSCSRWLNRAGRCRANMAHIRQSRPDYGLGFQVEVLKTVEVVSFPLGSG